MQHPTKSTHGEEAASELRRRALAAGERIAGVISTSSSVYYPGSEEYTRKITHTFGWATQESACVVEPGTVEDLSKTMKIISETRTPFAVKAGGCMQNPGFSSTRGIHISLARFSELAYHPTTDASTPHGTITLGPSLKWVDVYTSAELIKHGVNVAGGRVDSVGVGGLTLSGGYSWKTGQVGLTCDTVLEYDVVLSNGDTVKATKDENPDLFFGLKGGLNNFGIVTRFTFKAFPQTDIVAGSVFYDPEQTPKLLETAEKFWKENKDPKAQMMTNHIYIPAAQQLIGQFFGVYDAPITPPSNNGSGSIWDPFVSIPHQNTDIGKKTLAEVVTGAGQALAGAQRYLADTVALRDYSSVVVAEIIQLIQHWGKDATANNRSTILFGALVEPIHISAWSNATPSAFPHAYPHFPVLIVATWKDAADDGYMESAVKSIVQSIRDVAVREGQDVVGGTNAKYPGYAAFWTPLEDVYGESLPRLKEVKKKYDPEDVMGLAGGYKL